MTGPVYETIKKLFAANNGATLATIVSYSGLKKQHVLNVLAANKGLLRFHRTKIIRAYAKNTGDALKAAKATGQFYWETEINYGVTTKLEFPEGVNVEADAMRKGYTCGGMGDSHTVQVVLKDREDELRAIGMKPIAEADLGTFPGYVEWAEDVEDRAAKAAAQEIAATIWLTPEAKHIDDIAEIIMKHMK